jgi:hypothetical protein
MTDALDWQPPYKASHGYEFGDWRPIRDAIEAAYGEMGIERGNSIDRRDWNLVGLAMNYAEFASRPACVECKKRLRQHQIIRCLDCKMPLCEACAPRHFWPDGRPK